MVSVYIIVLVSVLGVVAAGLVFGYTYLFIKRWRREMKGDIYIMPQDTREKGEMPIELQAGRDKQYYRAGKDPYEKE